MSRLINVDDMKAILLSIPLIDGACPKQLESELCDIIFFNVSRSDLEPRSGKQLNLVKQLIGSKQTEFAQIKTLYGFKNEDSEGKSFMDLRVPDNLDGILDNIESDLVYLLMLRDQFADKTASGRPPGEVFKRRIIKLAQIYRQFSGLFVTANKNYETRKSKPAFQRFVECSLKAIGVEMDSRFENRLYRAIAAGRKEGSIEKKKTARKSA